MEKMVMRNRNRVVLLVDTPNVFETIRAAYGREFKPDYLALLSLAMSRAVELYPFPLVNDGYPKHFIHKLQITGYQVLLSEGKDCDFRFVEQAIAFHRHGDAFFLCSGDGRFVELAYALRALGKYVVVSAVRSRCANALVRSADEFFPFPVQPSRECRHLTSNALNKLPIVA
jgi:uncharacterized LabA/DUF88 family protein